MKKIDFFIFAFCDRSFILGRTKLKKYMFYKHFANVPIKLFKTSRENIVVMQALKE